MTIHHQLFMTARQLTEYVNSPPAGVTITSVVSITFDAASGMYVLFYS